MAKRELIDTGTDKRHVRRDEKGRITESVDVGRSLVADGRQDAKQQGVKARVTVATGERREVPAPARPVPGPGPCRDPRARGPGDPRHGPRRPESGASALRAAARWPATCSRTS
jgi:hypothetical protein